MEFEKKNILETPPVNSVESFPPMNESESLNFRLTRIEHYLDEGASACLLKNPQLAQLMHGTLDYFDERRYGLFAWCGCCQALAWLPLYIPGSHTVRKKQ